MLRHPEPHVLAQRTPTSDPWVAAADPRCIMRLAWHVLALKGVAGNRESLTTPLPPLFIDSKGGARCPGSSACPSCSIVFH